VGLLFHTTSMREESMPAMLFGSSPRQGVPRRAVLLFLVVTCLAATGGCASSRRRPQARAPRPVKPWMHVQSLALFPMSKAIPPQTPEMLASSMEKAWEARLNVPEGSDLVRIEGADTYPHVSAMTIDLSDVSVPKKSKQPKLKPRGQSEGALRVDNLELVARPLLLDKAKVLLGLSASDAKFELRRDKKGQPMLALAGAEDGRLSLEMSRKDLDTLLLQTARETAGKYGVAVDRTKLKLDMVGERSLRIDLKVNVRLAALLPAGLRVKARIDVDDKLNGKVVRLTCDGDQLLGPLISSVIDPQLRKYEGKTKPLVGFAFGKMKLRDLRIDVEDGFKLNAAFGNVAAAKTTATATHAGAGQRAAF
jgi:hypothetical protein